MNFVFAWFRRLKSQTPGDLCTQKNRETSLGKELLQKRRLPGEHRFFGLCVLQIMSGKPRQILVPQR
jgi:hypothetical protein